MVLVEVPNTKEGRFNNCACSGSLRAKCFLVDAASRCIAASTLTRQFGRMANQIIESVIVGIRRRWRNGITQAFSVMGAIWLLAEIVTRSSRDVDQLLTAHSGYFLAIVIVIAAIWFFLYSFETRFVRFRVPTTSSYITIKFGNIFEEKCNWLVGANEFFDGKIGQVIAPTSVHGQFISNVFNGDEGMFREAIDRALTGVPSNSTLRAIEPRNHYDIGTTAMIPNGRHHAFLVAMSKTDLTTHKASSTVPLLWTAMEGALNSIHNFGAGEPVAMPLIGNGLSSVNVEPQHLLRLLTLSLVDFGRKRGIPSEVMIVVPEACFEQLDIREIKRDWMQQ